MTVTVLVPGALRAEAGGSATLSLDVAGTLAEVLDALDEQWPKLGRRLRDERGELRRFVNIYVDGEECRYTGGLTTAVAPNAEIQVLPSVAGGA
jgi:molybdopterin converting factor small subunit